MSFFVRTPPSERNEVRKRLEILDQVKEVRKVERRVDIGREESVPILEVVPRHYKNLQDIAKIVASNGGYHDYALYNVDLRFGQRYCLAHKIFPCGLLWYNNGRWRAEEEQFALDYPLPKLRAELLDIHIANPLGIPRFQDKLLGARIGDVGIEGSESETLEKLNAAVRDLDPDVVLTDGGDAFTMPYLARKAAEHSVNLQLGRDPDRFIERRGKSYFTYGKIVYKPGQYLLKGRLHLDRGHFAYRESAMAGLAELSRLSLLMPQEQARLTPGTAISAMQVNLAIRDGCLVIWKKNRPEDFKTAEDLVLGDRGGFIFEPEVGLHEGLYELDFSALYPSIMAKYNISPECLDCSCCGGNAFPVPGLKYRLCTSRVGLIPRVLKPILERRRYYKKMKKEPGPLEEVYRDRDAILKWLLVTTFRLHRVQERTLRTHRVSRGDQRNRAGPPRSDDGNRRIPWVRRRPWHRGLDLAPCPRERGPDPHGHRPHRGRNRAHDRTRRAIQVDRVPPVQDDRRRRAEPVLWPLRKRRIQAPRH
ncbi:MAG TPA: DNA polymerase domain-containing protein [Thermoplasmata archaeon]|nr:DNA polymerase domain-containing protein [Thermoplasmata archaeon]